MYPAIIATLLTLVALVPQEAPEAFAKKRQIPADKVADAVFTAKRCSTCHTIRRVTKARYVGDEWEVCVEEMRDKEKSGISGKDAERITAFLSWWSTADEGGGAGPRSAPALRKQALWKAPRHSIRGSVQVAVGSALPLTVEISGRRVVLEKLQTGSADGRITVAARLRHGKTVGTATWIRNAAGQTATGMRLRTWKVGRFEFASSIHVDGVLSDAGDLESVRVLEVVRRTNWKTTDIGWPVPAAGEKATQPAKEPAHVPAKPSKKPRGAVCPLGHGG